MMFGQYSCKADTPSLENNERFSLVRSEIQFVNVSLTIKEEILAKGEENIAYEC